MVQKQTEKIIKVNLFHLSCLHMSVEDPVYSTFVDQALDYIWKSMHNSVVRLSLYHYEHADGKL